MLVTQQTHQNDTKKALKVVSPSVCKLLDVNHHIQGSAVPKLNTRVHKYQQWRVRLAGTHGAGGRLGVGLERLTPGSAGRKASGTLVSSMRHLTTVSMLRAALMSRCQRLRHSGRLHNCTQTRDQLKNKTNEQIIGSLHSRTGLTAAHIAAIAEQTSRRTDLILTLPLRGWLELRHHSTAGPSAYQHASREHGASVLTWTSLTGMRFCQQTSPKRRHSMRVGGPWRLRTGSMASAVTARHSEQVMLVRYSGVSMSWP